MSRYISGLVGVVALAASLGAAQLAIGHDLSGSSAKTAAAAQSDHINRSSKSDRPAGILPIASTTVVSQTLASRDMSVATRVTQGNPQRESKIFSRSTSRPVACEASASVLTEVAKLMESGRCVT